MTPTTILRPVHAWFFFWERAVPSLYRVVATGLAALVTAVVLAVFELPAYLAAGLSLALWIGLAVGQEHDQRVRLPADPNFLTALVDALSPPPLALTVESAHGPSRAQPEGWDTFATLSARGESSHPLGRLSITVERSAANGWLRLDVIDDSLGGVETIQERLRRRGEQSLSERIQKARSPVADAQAIASALRAAYW